jgi:hypothetical protein
MPRSAPRGGMQRGAQRAPCQVRLYYSRHLAFRPKPQCDVHLSLSPYILSFLRGSHGAQTSSGKIQEEPTAQPVL